LPTQSSVSGIFKPVVSVGTAKARTKTLLFYQYIRFDNDFFLHRHRQRYQNDKKHNIITIIRSRIYKRLCKTYPVTSVIIIIIVIFNNRYDIVDIIFVLLIRRQERIEPNFSITHAYRSKTTAITFKRLHRLTRLWQDENNWNEYDIVKTKKFVYVLWKMINGCGCHKFL